MPPFIAGISGFLIFLFLNIFVGGFLQLLLFGLDIKNVNINVFRIFTISVQVLLILSPALFLSKMIYEDVSTVIRLHLPSKKDIGFFSIGLIILLPLFQSYVYLQTYLLEKLAGEISFVNQIKTLLDKLNGMVEETFSYLLHTNTIFETSFVIFVVAVIPAICEEVFFRGYLQKCFELRFTPFIGALISAVIFGSIHLNPYGLLPLILLGLYFGYAAYKTNSIFVAIALHFFYNFVTVITYFILEQEELIDINTVDFENIEFHIFSFTILSVLFITFIYLLNRYYKSHREMKGDKNDLPKV
jgi:membrane protease YdiL (CAAX protease family)